MPETEDLKRLFARDLDRLGLPPRQRWVREGGRAPSLAAAAIGAALTAIVLVAALGVGQLLAQHRGAAVAPPPSPTAEAAPVLSDRFGFVWVESSRLRVGAESGRGEFQVDADLGRHSFSRCACAVSPDGTRIAYWTRQVPHELRILEVTRPGRQVAIYAAPEDRLISGAVWSNDGTGILFSLEGINPPGGPPRAPWTTSLHVIEASGGAARTLSSDRAVYVPLGWDRAAGVAAAGATGPGGFLRAYLTVRTTGDPVLHVTSIDETVPVVTIDVSIDQRWVLGLSLDDDGTASTVRWWRLGDFGTIQSGPRLPRGVQPRWRPFTNEIAWVEGGVLQLLDVERGTRRTGGAFPAGGYGLRAFRQDGSAVVGGPMPGPPVLLEIASGRSERITGRGSLVDGVRFR